MHVAAVRCRTTSGEAGMPGFGIGTFNFQPSLQLRQLHGCKYGYTLQLLK
jgi:hypothetical protein